MYELSNQFIHHFNYLSLKSKKSAFSTAFRLFRAYQFIHYFDVFKNWAPVHTSPTVFAAVHTSLALFTGQFIHHFNLFSVHTLPLCFAHQFIHHFTARANTAPQTSKRPSVPAARRFAARANTVPQTGVDSKGMPRGPGDAKGIVARKRKRARPQTQSAAAPFTYRRLFVLLRSRVASVLSRTEQHTGKDTLGLGLVHFPLAVLVLLVGKVN